MASADQTTTMPRALGWCALTLVLAVATGAAAYLAFGLWIASGLCEAGSDCPAGTDALPPALGAFLLALATLYALVRAVEQMGTPLAGEDA